MHEVGHERRQVVELALQPMVLHRHVLSLDVAGFVEALTERIPPGSCGCPAVHEADYRHRRLLRARCDRPRSRRATKREDKFAPPDPDCHETLLWAVNSQAMEATISRFDRA